MVAAATPHRPEVDGLRAVAVLPVILFHAGFDTFRGGFVGVDVFFVISGYLITTIILADMAAGRFALARFYERRARRILPALLLVMAACVPFAWWWLDPVDLKDFARSLVAVSLFGSNLLFWREGGYFASAAELKPLLHTWSLALEEQYYLGFPLLVLLMMRWGRRSLAVLLALLAMASLGLAHAAVPHKPEAAFLLMPTRAWELAVGGLASLWHFRAGAAPGSATWRQVASLLGLAAIVVAVLSFDSHTRHPGLPTLLPVLGAALVLLHADPQTWVGRWLGTRVPVALGLVSYSAYLWHQPLFAFYRLRMLADPAPAVALLLAVAALGLAYLSWRWVEQPCRAPQRVSSRSILVLTLGGSLAFVALGLLAWASPSVTARQPVPESLARSFDVTQRTAGCFDVEPTTAVPQWMCALGDGGAAPDFIVFGDSHANALYEAFDRASRGAGRQGRFAAMSGCIPLLGVHLKREWQSTGGCFDFNRRVHKAVRQSGVKQVVLVAKWTRYTDGGYAGQHLAAIGAEPGSARDRDSSRAAFVEGLRRTVDSFARMGVRVVVISQVPEQRVSARRVAYRAAAQGLALDTALRDASVERSRHEALQAFVGAAFASQPGIALLSPDDLLCDAQVCLAGDADGGYYIDESHLSLHGAQRLDPIAARALQR